MLCWTKNRPFIWVQLLFFSGKFEGHTDPNVCGFFCVKSKDFGRILVARDMIEIFAKQLFYTAMQGTCSCLGIEPPRFPSDENIISKLAVAVYTNRGGPVEDRGLRIFEVLQLQILNIYYKSIRFFGGHEEEGCFSQMKLLFFYAFIDNYPTTIELERF